VVKGRGRSDGGGIEVGEVKKLKRKTRRDATRRNSCKVVELLGALEPEALHGAALLGAPAAAPKGGMERVDGAAEQILHDPRGLLQLA
jgi:hypothetical protein